MAKKKRGKKQRLSQYAVKPVCAGSDNEWGGGWYVLRYGTLPARHERGGPSEFFFSFFLFGMRALTTRLKLDYLH
jgi:hypothetical protein